jgi:acetyltransferase-like isoleucine patch superfamily enzyme
VKIGRVFWAKDGVNLFAGGPLIIGDSCVFAERSAIWSGKEGVFIGDRCFLGVGSYISAIRGKVKIGNDVMIADHVRFYTWNHKFSKGRKTHSEMGALIKGITIGNNCWLGTGSIVLPGVKLGNNSVAAAGSVLTKSYPDNSLIAGVPAKVIKKIR